jgi:hypothetical protein
MDWNMTRWQQQLQDFHGLEHGKMATTTTKAFHGLEHDKMATKTKKTSMDETLQQQQQQKKISMDWNMTRSRKSGTRLNTFDDLT